MKDKLSKILARKEFYIVLSVGILTLALAGAVVSRGGLRKQKEDNLSKEEDLIIVAEDEPALETSQMLEEKKEREEEEVNEAREEETQEEREEQEDGDLEFVEDEGAEPEASPDNPEGMLAPVEGKIGLDFAKDELVYSETLEEWTTHYGVDIFAREGQEVKAALSGEIREVYEDELWGKVIIIDHGNELMTKYANLSTTDMVAEGSRVEKGIAIGKVGTSAKVEMIMEPHIHFEVIRDGVNVDPKDYIPGLGH